LYMLLEHQGIATGVELQIQGPNGLPITRAAQMDPDDVLADPNAQNSSDPVDAQQRRV